MLKILYSGEEEKFCLPLLDVLGVLFVGLRKIEVE